MKLVKTIIYIAIAVVLVFVLSSLFIAQTGREANDASPLEQDRFSDSLDSMSAQEKQEFNDAVEQAKNDVMVMDDSMDSSAQLLLQGMFKPRAHEVEGNALLIQDGDKNILRFEDFSTINGPNLHIYLSADLGGDDYIDLGAIKATKGNVNYDVPENVDLNKYNKVLVWCVPFRVLFSYAELQ